MQRYFALWCSLYENVTLCGLRERRRGSAIYAHRNGRPLGLYIIVLGVTMPTPNSLYTKAEYAALFSSHLGESVTRSVYLHHVAS